MRFDSIRAPRSLRRTPTERFRDAVYAQRSRTSPADREVRLPFTMPVYGGGSPRMACSASALETTMIALPDVERPKPIEDAATVLEARERDLHELEGELRSARVGLDEARATDRAEYARRRDAGEDDVGPVHLGRARANLDDVERRHGRAAARAVRVRDSTARSPNTWTSGGSLERALERADAASLRALAKLETVEGDRAALRAAHAWVLRPTSPLKTGAPHPSPIKRNLSGDRSRPPSSSTVCARAREQHGRRAARA